MKRVLSILAVALLILLAVLVLNTPTSAAQEPAKPLTVTITLTAEQVADIEDILTTQDGPMSPPPVRDAKGEWVLPEKLTPEAWVKRLVKQTIQAQAAQAARRSLDPMNMDLSTLTRAQRKALKAAIDAALVKK